MRSIRDLIIRRKLGFARIDTERFSVRIARTVSEYEDAFALLRTAYVAQGFDRVLGDSFRITDHHLLAASTVFVAYEGDVIVGTATVTADSDAGLPMDHQHPDAMRALRAEGDTLAEIGSLAIVGRCFSSGVAPLLSLATVRHAVRHMNVTRVAMGVGTKAQAYYEAAWACRQISTARQHSSLDISIVLLAADLQRTRRHFKRHFSRPMQSGASASDYVFGDSSPPWHDLPEDLAPADAARWKMPREVFRELFLRRTDKLQDLADDIRSEVAKQRTRDTLYDIPCLPACAAPSGRGAGRSRRPGRATRSKTSVGVGIYLAAAAKGQPS